MTQPAATFFQPHRQDFLQIPLPTLVLISDKQRFAGLVFKFAGLLTDSRARNKFKEMLVEISAENIRS